MADLASKLMDNGVDVVLDQWDLGLGDDAIKFMEHGVTTANRVLMICTASYVRKVNDGQGGAGYEGMIVTGELVRNLGTSKFIPVIRQEAGSRLVGCLKMASRARFSCPEFGPRSRLIPQYLGQLIGFSA
jgi:TIR domain